MSLVYIPTEHPKVTIRLNGQDAVSLSTLNSYTNSMYRYPTVSRAPSERNVKRATMGMIRQQSSTPAGSFLNRDVQLRLTDGIFCPD